MKTISISRAMWSPSVSGALCGWDKDGEYFTTPQLFSHAEGVYRGLDGVFYSVDTWQPDGRGYKDEKKGEL